MSKPRSIFGPLFLIAAGVVWILVSSNTIPSSNLWALTRIWPYLLIAAGLGMILRAYWKYATILLDVLIITGAFLAVFFAPRLGWDSPSMFWFVGGDDFYLGPSEAGSGNIITSTREVSGFDAVEVDFPAQVFISQGESESVEIEAEDNLLPGLRTEVRNGELRIYYKPEDGKYVSPREIVRVTIVVKELKEVDFNSAGELVVEGLEADELNVSISGAGNLELKDITTDELSVNLSGAGSMTASGVTDSLDVDISGFGDFKGGDLHGRTVRVQISGAGSATVWVDDYLDAEISGAGSVNYYGAANVNKHINGIGNVNHLGNK